MFLVAIFLSKIFQFLLHPVVCMFSCYLLPLVDRIFFRCWGMSCFVSIVLPFVDISLIFLLSPLFSGLFPQVGSFFLVLPFFLSLHDPASFLCFIILASFCRFFSAFPVEFPILVLIFSLCFLRESQFPLKLISPRSHRLIHLIRLYHSLIYKLVVGLFSSFPS